MAMINVGVLENHGPLPTPHEVALVCKEFLGVHHAKELIW